MTDNTQKKVFQRCSKRLVDDGDYGENYCGLLLEAKKEQTLHELWTYFLIDLRDFLFSKSIRVLFFGSFWIASLRGTLAVTASTVML